MTVLHNKNVDEDNISPEGFSDLAGDYFLDDFRDSEFSGNILFAIARGVPWQKICENNIFPIVYQQAGVWIKNVTGNGSYISLHQSSIVVHAVIENP